MKKIDSKHIEEIEKIKNDTIKIQGEIANNSKKLDIELQKIVKSFRFNWRKISKNQKENKNHWKMR